ncbi:hypothetical protein [Roseomonas xinghualingensis]|uniref:hypothetical protein n=1 Tax=Roseomonas xinghualingensis TaxID=2986475 RepID=UPI0021F184CD|nr:hypothetical protein [Roseomonas sp. SXEYE001]MCV4208424.1 hypothetical protein [Roseomonas sp. SXEYE001]
MIRRSLLRLAALLPVLLAAAPAVAQPVILRDITGREASLPGSAKLATSLADHFHGAPSGMNRRLLSNLPLQGTYWISLR